MVSVALWPQAGQVTVERNSILVAGAELRD
jgi:hypothetical protein